MNRILIFFTFLLLSSAVSAQNENENYNVYIAVYENDKPGSTLFREDLINLAPIEDYNFVMITGLKYKSTREDGFPDMKVLDLLQTSGDELAEALDKEMKNIFAGSFTSNGERLEYFYLQDKEGVQSFVEDFYKKNYPKEEYYLNIREDKDWKAYLEFLYPNELTRNYMTDESVIDKLTEMGDVLNKERRVDHWAYFQTKEDMKTFKEEIIALNFKVESTNKIKDTDTPFQIQFFKDDMVDMSSINPVTTKLLQIAKKHNGEYDGWETFIVKE